MENIGGRQGETAARTTGPECPEEGWQGTRASSGPPRLGAGGNFLRGALGQGPGDASQRHEGGRRARVPWHETLAGARNQLRSQGVRAHNGPFYGEQSSVESWCVSCQSSPRGCGELGFLHILMLLKPGTRGLPGLGRAPSPAPMAGSPAQGLEGTGAGALAPSRASGSSGLGWAAGAFSSARPRARCCPSGAGGFFPTASLEWVCFTAVCLTGHWAQSWAKGLPLS